MSYAVEKLNTVRVLDPLVNVSSERFYAVLSGGSRISWKPFTTNSFDESSFQFACPPPSPNIFVDRKVYLKTDVTINFTGTENAATPDGGIIQAGVDALRAYPLSSNMNVLTVTINNTAVSVNMSDTIRTLLRMHNPVQQRNQELSLSPSMQDQSQNYVDLMGGIRNPLSVYADSASGADEPRGGFLYSSFNPGPTGVTGPTSASLTTTLCEPLFLSPFLFGAGDDSAFLGVQTLDFNITWNANLARFWSHMLLPSNQNPATLSSVSVTFNNPVLLFKYITPSLLQRLPRSISYPYFSIDRYPTTPGTSLAAKQSGFVMASNNIQLKSIPRKIVIAARRQNSDEDFTTTDTYLSITAVNVNWNNESGLLSSATQQDLYNIAKKNGVNLSYSQWAGGYSFVSQSIANTSQIGLVGSVLPLEMGTDIALREDECPGMLGTYQLQVNATVTNINTLEAIVPTLYLIIISEGVFTVLDNRSVSQIGVVSKLDVIESRMSPYVDYNVLYNIHGGNFFSSIKSFGEKVLSGLKRVHDFAKQHKLLSRGLSAVSLIPQAAAVAGPAAQIARAVGYGDGGVLVDPSQWADYGPMQGSGRYKRGGKKMSRADLRKHIIM